MVWGLYLSVSGRLGPRFFSFSYRSYSNVYGKRALTRLFWECIITINLRSIKLNQTVFPARMFSFILHAGVRDVAILWHDAKS
jgi:hypothetical protein